MGKFSLEKEMNIEICASFISKGSNTPITGDRYRLRLFDRDIFGEDYLGECQLNGAGIGNIQFAHKDFTYPFDIDFLTDFYFVLYQDNLPIFQSKVMENVDLQMLQQYRPGKGELVDLGKFLVDI